MTSANSVNVGRLLPQMIYYFQAVAQLAALGHGAAASGSPTTDASRAGPHVVFCTPSGNFGNLTAGLMARRAGLPAARFVAATNINDVVPEYLTTGRYQPRASKPTIANAMDVGHPSNFERMLWLYGQSVDAMRTDIAGACYADDQVRDTIRRTFERCGYLLDPHSAIAYLGITGFLERVGQVGIFLATAHPAKFAEIVEPIVGRSIPKPAPLAEALARARPILRIPATLDAVKEALGA
jgi:threonine synthase